MVDRLLATLLILIFILAVSIAIKVLWNFDAGFATGMAVTTVLMYRHPWWRVWEMEEDEQP